MTTRHHVSAYGYQRRVVKISRLRQFDRPAVAETVFGCEIASCTVVSNIEVVYLVESVSLLEQRTVHDRSSKHAGGHEANRFSSPFHCSQGKVCVRFLPILAGSFEVKLVDDQSLSFSCITSHPKHVLARDHILSMAPSRPPCVCPTHKKIPAARVLRQDFLFHGRQSSLARI